MKFKEDALKWKRRVERAQAGDEQALEAVLAGIQDEVFNLSLRMLGMVPDAEDATQEILMRVMVKLPTFRGDSAFRTWVYRLAVNHLLNYRKSMFAQRPLSFEFYGADISAVQPQADFTEDVERRLLAKELEMSCMNVMLQCLDAESRCIFILGTMFRLDSRTAGEALGLSPEVYRQRLSRARRRMADFLARYCGLTGAGMCSCMRRVDYAVSQHRIDPKNRMFEALKPLDEALLSACVEEMESLDELAQTFERLPSYRSTVDGPALARRLIDSPEMRQILREEAATDE